MLKNIFIAILGMALWAGLATAQTCKPVSISFPNPDPTDAGNGAQDNVQFGIYWWSFDHTNTHASITVTAGPYFFNSATSGYVNALSNLFDGCPLTSWTQFIEHQYVLHDTDTGAYWNYPSVGTGNYICDVSKAKNCQFGPLWDPYSGQHRTDLVHGHHYRLDLNTYAVVYQIGTSPTYTHSIYITVE